MKIRVATVPLEKQKPSAKTCSIIAVFEDGELTPAAEALDKISRGFINALMQKGMFKGKIDQCLPLFQLPHTAHDCVLLVGCGSSQQFSVQSLTKIINKSIQILGQQPGCTHLINYLSELYSYMTPASTTEGLPWLIKYLTEETIAATYRFDIFKSKKTTAFNVKEMVIHLPQVKLIKNCEEAAKQGQAIAKGVAFAKDLGNLPSNICTPTFLAAEAKSLAKSYANVSANILTEKEMAQLGMGALLAVSQGSAEPAKLICLEYKGKRFANKTKNKGPIVFVGKGITFDTGGNSLKLADAMVGMKYDMCGAATVLGVIKAAAELELPLHLVGIIPAVENMPGGTAYKPEDILTSLSGQTIEVISTDAEGRLILADALTYCERYQPATVIDIATLTGAAVIALGHQVTALMANDSGLAKALLEAGEISLDRAWQLPLFAEYQEQIKSNFADMANVGGRTAGAITAGCFLSRFTKKFRWAHLDVAGTAAMMSGMLERRATGRPVPLLMQYLLNLLENPH